MKKRVRKKRRVRETTPGRDAMERKERTEKRRQREGFSDDLVHQLDRLDEKYRTPLLMSAMDDYSYKEISSALDIPVGTVMSRIHRGRALLRRALSEDQP